MIDRLKNAIFVIAAAVALYGALAKYAVLVGRLLDRIDASPPASMIASSSTLIGRAFRSVLLRSP
jgi:hypothetical protein